MMTDNKEFILTEVFRFKELSSSAQDQARYSLTNMWQTADDLRENFKELLNSDWGVKSLTPHFSLSYSQGDGVSLVGTIPFFELSKPLRKCLAKGFTIADWRAFHLLSTKFLDSTAAFSFCSSSYHYYHKYTVVISPPFTSSYDFLEPCSMKMFDYLWKTAEKMTDNLESWHSEICDKFEEAGYQFFEPYSDSQMEEFEQEYDLRFQQDGTIIFDQEVYREGEIISDGSLHSDGK